MMFQFDVKGENGRMYVFTKVGDTEQEAMDKIPLEAEKRGIYQDLEVVETRYYQSGGIWVNKDGKVHTEVEPEPEKDETVEEVKLEEEEGQLTLAL